LILLARKLDTNPPTIALESILLIASITRTKRRGERFSLAKARELPKTPYRLTINQDGKSKPWKCTQKSTFSIYHQNHITSKHKRESPN
jgi:hypothetical protein